MVRTFTVLFVVFLLIASMSCTKSTDFQYQPNTFIKEWLICGPFPNSLNCPIMDYKHGACCDGFFTDYLESMGGEAKAKPTSGDKISIPDKDINQKWFLYKSPEDKISLNSILTPNDMVVAYAFTHIVCEEDQKSILSVGSNDGIRVFLNGEQIHEMHPRNGRWLQADNDFVPVNLKTGINNLMLKIDDGAGDYGFVVRFLDYDSTMSYIRKNITSHNNISLVAFEDSLATQFGQPYKIETLNPGAKVKIALVHEKAGILAERIIQPGFETRFFMGDMPDGFITAKATFETPEYGTIVSEIRHYKGKLKRHPVPKQINTKNGVISVDGKPFFPIGTYGAPVEDYDILKQAGYNFVVGSAENLDKIHEAGLKAAVHVHGSPPDWLEVAKTINKHKNHPAVLCWMLYDEPGYNRADLLDIYNLYNVVYKADPDHPSYLVITTPSVYKTFGQCCDILSVDTYPVAQGDIVSVGGNIAKAYRETEQEQPLWHCGQLFKWPAQRVPTAQEHRYMTYSALMEGANGLLWYVYKGYGQYLLVDTPDLWEAHKELLKEVIELTPLFLERKIGKKITLAEDNEFIHGYIIKRSLGSFAIVVNDSKTETFVSQIKVPLTNGSISVYGEDRNVAVSEGIIKDEFKPLDVHIYQL